MRPTMRPDKRAREAIRRSSVPKHIGQQCEAMAAEAGFRKQLGGPFEFHIWQRELSDHRILSVNRLAPLPNVRPELKHLTSWVGHLGYPDKPYWTVGFAQSTADRREVQVLGVKHELTLTEAFAFAAKLESGEFYFDPSNNETKQ